MRLGIVGGTFDPVHYGHLLLAESCREALKLDRVWFVPASIPPHKQAADLTADKHRVEMLRLAIAGHDAFGVSLLEVDRGGVSYTFETLAAIREQLPDAELLLLLGADTLADLPNWRYPERICELAAPAVVRRPGAPAPDFTPLAPLLSAERYAAVSQQLVEMPLVGFSSSEIRRRIAAGQSIRYRTPRSVERYIETHGLYRSTVQADA